MRTHGTPKELEHRRQLAVQRHLEGSSAEEIAEFLDVAPRTVWRWLALFQGQGPDGLLARPVPGRPRKLTATQEKIVLRWLSNNPLEQGFTTELWSAPRLAQLIQQEFGIRLKTSEQWGCCRRLGHERLRAVERSKPWLASPRRGPENHRVSSPLAGRCKKRPGDKEPPSP
jgi:transposase